MDDLALDDDLAASAEAAEPGASVADEGSGKLLDGPDDDEGEEDDEKHSMNSAHPADSLPPPNLNLAVVSPR
jgi:hypothetical protein